MPDHDELIEQVVEKFEQLDVDAKEFVLGYLTGRRDEKLARANA